MKDTYRKIGTEWVNINPKYILEDSDFINSPLYKDCIEKGKNNIERYVNNNKTMLFMVSEQSYGDNYALRQLIYQNAVLSSIIDDLQKEGRYRYRNETMDKIKAAIAPEYANLPEFFRNAYSIDDIASSYFSKATADLKNQINKASTAYFYQNMRDHIRKII